MAGYNRYLKDNAATLPASCKEKAWVRPIIGSDIARLTMGVGVRHGLGRFQKEIANEQPNEPSLAQAEFAWPAGIGSNAVAIGKDTSASGRGILFGNPHYPWHGSSRFHLIHTTIPGELDVMGTSLLNTSRVSIGFNNDVAWSHTLSTALRFTLYELKLNPDNPLEYLYDGEYRPIHRQAVSIPTEEGRAAHDVYLTHYGPMLTSERTPSTDTTVYALRDAVIDNYETADTYDELNKAKSTADIEAAISKQGVFWVNTIAADRHGNAFYADISGTPNIDAGLLEKCRVENEELGDRVVVPDGSKSACEWKNDPRSNVPGTLPAAEMPRVTRTDYVTNSNDSYWLSNPHEPIEGYSPIIGNERTARSLRTRAGLVFLEERIAAKGKLEPSDVEGISYSQRNYGAELLLDDLLEVCAGDHEIAPACNTLRNWDRTMTTDSRGSQVWTEFLRTTLNANDLHAVAFDPDDPVHTPRGYDLDAQNVRQRLRNALITAQNRLADAGIALDAKLGDIQYAQRNDKRIPIPGGQGWAGMFSMIVANLTDGKGYTPIIHGNSYMQVIAWDKQGNLKPRAMLTYSQSPEPESPHYADLTQIYSQGGWIELPFQEKEIASDPNLREIHLTE